MTKDKAKVKTKRKFQFAPFALMTPGMLWLLLFFFVPLVILFIKSLSVRQPDYTTVFDWNWSNYTKAFSDFGDQFKRSFIYSGIATVVCLLMAFPLAYVIAFRGGRWKNFYMGLVMVPFFTSFLIRTFSWKTIIGSQGPIFIHFVGPNATFPVLDKNFTLIGTSTAVIGGLIYNFLPFMVLPIYVALEKIDSKLMSAARDLYANTFTAFRKIILPLAAPGVFAGCLLVFIPASGDFINAEILSGSKDTTMIGTVIEGQFLTAQQYPLASAISFVFMLIILVLFVAYSTVFDAEDLAG